MAMLCALMQLCLVDGCIAACSQGMAYSGFGRKEHSQVFLNLFKRWRQWFELMQCLCCCPPESPVIGHRKTHLFVYCFIPFDDKLLQQQQQQQQHAALGKGKRNERIPPMVGYYVRQLSGQTRYNSAAINNYWMFSSRMQWNTD